MKRRADFHLLEPDILLHIQNFEENIERLKTLLNSFLGPDLEEDLVSELPDGSSTTSNTLDNKHMDSDEDSTTYPQGLDRGVLPLVLDEPFETRDSLQVMPAILIDTIMDNRESLGSIKQL